MPGRPSNKPYTSSQIAKICKTENLPKTTSGANIVKVVDGLFASGLAQGDKAAFLNKHRDGLRSTLINVFYKEPKDGEDFLFEIEM